MRSVDPSRLTPEEVAALQMVGQDLYASLTKLELKLNEAMAEAGDFGAKLARAPQAANLAPSYGQGVVTRIAQILPLLAEARSCTGVAHQGLAKIQRELGVTLVWPFDEDGGVSPFSTPVNKPPPPSGSAEVIAFPPETAAA